MVILTQSLEHWLFVNHRTTLPLILLGHTELFTEEMQKEYIEWCKTDDGKQYLEGGSKYNPKHESVKENDMARYIDADRLIKTIFPLDCVDKKHYTINAQSVYNAIKNAPTEDVATKSEYIQQIAERQAAEEAIREIFAEIDDMLRIVKIPCIHAEGHVTPMQSGYLAIYHNDYVELKKKYIGEADDPANQS